MPLTLYKTFAWQTFASLRLFTCLVYFRTYCVPIAHLRQNKPFPLLYLGHAQIKTGTQAQHCFSQIVCVKTLIKGIFKILVYTPSDLPPRFSYKVNLYNTNLFRNTKRPAFFFYFGLPFRQRNATCKLAATRPLQPRTLVCCIKLSFGDIQLSPQSLRSPTEWLERL